MELLETDTIKAPTLYKTDNAGAKKFKKVIDDILHERDKLKTNKEVAQEQMGRILNDIEQKKGEMSSTFDKDVRDSLKESITSLENEYNKLQAQSDIDINQVLMDKVASKNIHELETKAGDECNRWIAELNKYDERLRKECNQSTLEVQRIRDRNIYKNTKTKWENLKRSLLK